ncbi:isochorismatase family protein [Streptomyces sp. SDr-06]|uniref:isochorismatase family protein n=1 Tax=Streptomyces sp. SDr-06 TaxID=2267702 RepID=UPI000DE9AA38|nr:isochorismatase family protein [Streptomyces sp. SDr-06]RCH64868.1 isochorismatase family protein [Streptomyces sp. SDr-06]
MTARALIVIDVQDSFRNHPLWRTVSNPDIVDDVNRLVDHARAQGDLVIWCLHTEPGTGMVFDPSSGQVAYQQGLREPLPDEPQIRKTSINAFTTTNLQQILTERGICDLAICGIRTEQCCETTTRVAADLGYRVTFVVDATATNPIPHWEAPAGRTPEEILADPRTLSAEAVIERTLFALAGRFASIKNIDQVVAEEAEAAVPR